MDLKQKYTKETIMLDFDVSIFISNLMDRDLINDVLLKLSYVEANDDAYVGVASMGRFFLFYYYIDDDESIVFDEVAEINSDEYLDLIIEGNYVK